MASLINIFLFVANHLKKMINKLNANNENHVIKKWSDAFVITPEMVGHCIVIYNCKLHSATQVKGAMVGHKIRDLHLHYKFKLPTHMQTV
ncbi:hypothetical protein R6Q57_009167 [Mikania cordata]